MGLKVSIDCVKHLIPKKEGKKEWFVVQISSEYAENETQFGKEHMNDLFMEPAAYAQYKDIIAQYCGTGTSVEAITEAVMFGGKLQLAIVGFKEIPGEE